MASKPKLHASSLLVMVSTPWQLFCALGLLFGPYRHTRRTLLLLQSLDEPGLRQVAALVDETQPDEIIGGNDRRVELQYAMAHANRRRYTLGA